MTLSRTLHRQLLVAALAASTFVQTVGGLVDRHRPLDDLINRPSEPFACLPSETACEPGI